MIIIIIIISVDKNNKFKKITATKILKQYCQNKTH